MKYSLIMISAATLGFAACNTAESTPAPESGKKAAASMETVALQHRGLSVPYELPAQLTAWQQVSLYPRMNGFVQKVLVDIGQHVRKGDLLLTIEAPEQEQSVVQARERLAKTEADFAAAKEQFDRLSEADRTAGAVSPLDLSNAKAKMDAAASLRNAEKAVWDAQRIFSGYLYLRAPFDGVITERNVSVGALVSAADRSKPMLEIKQVDLLRLQFDLPESVAPLVQVGDHVGFSITSWPGKSFTAVISRTSGDISASLRNMRAEADIPNAKGPFSPGMFARVKLSVKGDSSAWTIPASSLINSTLGKFVLLADGQHVKKLSVRIGHSEGGFVEVYGSFREGDRVILHADEEMAER
jgi:membrane fusion protein, multidrug efflux system